MDGRACTRARTVPLERQVKLIYQKKAIKNLKLQMVDVPYLQRHSSKVYHVRQYAQTSFQKNDFYSYFVSLVAISGSTYNCLFFLFLHPSLPTLPSRRLLPSSFPF